MTAFEVSTLHKWGAGDLAAFLARVAIDELAAPLRLARALALAALARNLGRHLGRPCFARTPARWASAVRSADTMHNGPPPRSTGGAPNWGRCVP